jgi:hypothetical protein
MTSLPDEPLLSLKVLVILRKSVSRELSAHNHKKKSIFGGFNTLNDQLKKNYSSFDECVDNEFILELNAHNLSAHSLYCTYLRQWHDILECDLFTRNLYSTHLRHWFDILKRDQKLILSYHELKSDPMTFQHWIEDFLGLPPNSGKSMMKTRNEKIFSGKDAVPSC